MIYLSKNFALSEFMCPGVKEKELLEKLDSKLIAGLQRLREMAGVPIKITSGYRTKKYNKKVNGSETSLHMEGKAADIIIQGLSPKEMYNLAEQVEIFKEGGIGRYPRHIHVDTGPKRRWIVGTGKYREELKPAPDATTQTPDHL